MTHPYVKCKYKCPKSAIFESIYKKIEKAKINREDYVDIPWNKNDEITNMIIYSLYHKKDAKLHIYVYPLKSNT